MSQNKIVINVNLTEQQTKELTQNITLLLNNATLDDFKRLANLAQQKPQTFKMALNHLRNL